MKSKEHSDIYNEILRLIKKKPRTGLSSAEIAGLLKFEISKRNVTRYLNQFIENNLVHKIGNGPNTRYVLNSESTSTKYSKSQPKKSKIKNNVENEEPRYFQGIAISPESLKIVDFLAQPLPYRPQTSYNADFLHRYIPNVTYYLDKRTIETLHNLGDTSSKSQVSGTFIKDVLNRVLIDLSWASSQLEGNTYSRLETKNLIEFGKPGEGKLETDTQMILNHKRAIEFLVNHIEDLEINRYTILNIHTFLAQSLIPDERDLGTIRTKVVGIGGSNYSPHSIPQVITDNFNLILEKASQILDPFEQSFFLMVHIPYLQPFIDVNKRVSRLSANIPLIKNNLCPLTFISMPKEAYIQGLLGIYELNDISLLRDVYLYAYERSASEYLAQIQTLIAPDKIFVKYQNEILELVHKIVKSNPKNIDKTILQFSKNYVAPEDLEKFEFILHNRLKNVREGTIALYNLTMQDLEKWNKRKNK